MKKRNDNHSKFLKYAKTLKAVEGIKAKLTTDQYEEHWVFISPHPQALEVNLVYHIDGMISDEVSLDIAGTDSGFWHTEETDLDFHIKMAVAALKGKVASNVTRIFKFEELCFRVDGAWECTRKGSPRYGYIKRRRKIRENL